MKVIDLLNKIANGEEVPKEIEIEGEDYLFYYQEDINSYKNYHNQYLMSDYLFNTARLNKEIYIVDKEIPEKIDEEFFEAISSSYRDRIMKEKINKIIDYLEEKEQ